MSFVFKKQKSLFATLSIIICLCISISFVRQVDAATGTPSILSYQGRLTNSSGDLLGGSSGTTYYFKFSIWDSATVGSGTRLWPSSSPSAVSSTVRQGVFTVNIGDTASGYPHVLDYNFNTNSSIYLQVEVSSDNSTFETLSPRQQITSAAFARLSSAVSGTTTPSSFGTTTPIGSSVVTIQATSTASTLLSLRSYLGQTASIFQIQNSNASSLFFVDATGGVFASSTLQVSGASRLYGALTVDGFTLLAQASSTRFSVNDLLYVGGTSTTTISGGNASSTFAGGVKISSGGFRVDSLTSCDSIDTTSEGYLVCGTDATGAGGGVATIQEGDSTISSSATTIDFLASDFIVTDSPSAEGNISIDYTNSGITRVGQNELVTGAWNFTGLTTFGQASSTRQSIIDRLYIGGTATTTILGNAATSTFSGGITLSSGSINIPTGSQFLINNARILDATSLGASIVSSSLTSVGTISSGTWQGSAIGVAYGGTGQTSFGQGWLSSNGTTFSASTSPTVNYITATSTTATSTFAAAIQATHLNLTSTTASTTAANGFNITTGCFAINGTCIGGSGGGGGSGTVNSGTANRLAYYGSSGTTISETSASLVWDNTNGFLGIGTSTPYTQLSVGGNAVIDGFLRTSYLVSTSTATSTFAGGIGIASTSPWGLFAVEQGTETNSLVISNSGSTSPSFVINGVNGNGNIGIATTSTLAKLSLDGVFGISENTATTTTSTLSGFGSFYTRGVSLNNDHYFASVTTLLHMDGSNNSTTFTDKSNSAVTITANGNAKVSTAQSKFGGASAVFDDSSSSYLSTSGSAAYNLSGSEFTIEFWFRATALSVDDVLISIHNDSAPGAIYFAGTPKKISFGVPGSWGATNGATTINPDTWYHVALVRSGGSTVLYLNGVSETSDSRNPFTDANNKLNVGHSTPGGSAAMSAFAGYIDDLRITKNLARYTTTFAVPTEAYPDNDSGTRSALVYKSSSGTEALLDGWKINNTDLYLPSNIGLSRVGIGTSTPISTLSVQGSLCVRLSGSCGTTAGTIYATTASLSDIDLAENYSTTDTTLVAGEIASLDPANPKHIKKASRGDKVLGIVSTNPGLLLGKEIEGGKPVALSGRVPLKVIGEGGSIAIGDRIALSSTSGLGMKATTTGETVAIALEQFTAGSDSDTDTIEVFVNLANHIITEQLNIMPNGNVGIGLGTSTPEYKLHVAGDVAATSFVNFSARDTKKDIEYLADEDKTSILERIGKIKIANYRYKIDEDEAPLRLGLIAEEAPLEVLSVGGKGVDVYKLSTFILAGVQEQQKQIESITSRLKLMEERFGTILSTTTPSLPLGGLWAGIQRFVSLVADKLTTKELCLEDVCIDKTKLKALLNNANLSSASSVSAITSPSPSPTPTPTATSTPPTSSVPPESSTSPSPSPTPTPTPSPTSLTSPEPVAEMSEPSPAPVETPVQTTVPETSGAPEPVVESEPVSGPAPESAPEVASSPEN